MFGFVASRRNLPRIQQRQGKNAERSLADFRNVSGAAAIGCHFLRECTKVPFRSSGAAGAAEVLATASSRSNDLRAHPQEDAAHVGD